MPARDGLLLNQAVSQCVLALHAYAVDGKTAAALDNRIPAADVLLADDLVAVIGDCLHRHHRSGLLALCFHNDDDLLHLLQRPRPSPLAGHDSPAGGTTPPPA